VVDELELLRNKTGATRLAFALFLKYLPWKGRVPRGRAELADNAIEHVARQVDVPPKGFGFYDWSGRQAKRHRMEIRRALAFRKCGVGDADKLARWLSEHVAVNAHPCGGVDGGEPSTSPLGAPAPSMRKRGSARFNPWRGSL
jgi:hypothetical protein